MPLRRSGPTALQAPRNARSQRHLPEAGISAEKLIASKTRERHLQPSAPCDHADEIRVDTIQCRLVHRREQPRKLLDEVGAAHPVRVMPSAEASRKRLRIWCLVGQQSPHTRESQA